MEEASSEDSASSRPKFRLYSTPNHHVTKGRYITSNDPRGYIPVYEYPLNGQWIMMDIDDGHILWTGIWKALGNSKADIVKMVDSHPDLAPQLRRVRGGYLKIQGTWMPYEVALRLSRRVAWPIRHDLIPLFGPTFPSTCLSPDQPGYGQIITPASGRRRPRRNVQLQPTDNPQGSSTNASSGQLSLHHYSPITAPVQRTSAHSRSDGISTATAWQRPPDASYPSSFLGASGTYTAHDQDMPPRFEPYPRTVPVAASQHMSVFSSHRASSVAGLPPSSVPLPSPHADLRPHVQSGLHLPPINLTSPMSRLDSFSAGARVSLPSISTLDENRSRFEPGDSTTVLKWLTVEDNLNPQYLNEGQLSAPQDASLSRSDPHRLPPSTWRVESSTSSLHQGHHSLAARNSNVSTRPSWQSPLYPHSPYPSDPTSVRGSLPSPPSPPQTRNTGSSWSGPSRPSSVANSTVDPDMSRRKRPASPVSPLSDSPDHSSLRRFVRDSHSFSSQFQFQSTSSSGRRSAYDNPARLDKPAFHGAAPRMSACRRSCEEDESDTEREVVRGRKPGLRP